MLFPNWVKEITKVVEGIAHPGERTTLVKFYTRRQHIKELDNTQRAWLRKAELTVMHRA